MAARASIARADAAPRRPSPAIAAFLTILGPGLGHVYARAWPRGARWLVAWVAIEGPLLWLAMRASPRAALIALPSAALVIWVAAMIDAARCARRASGGARPMVVLVALGALAGIAWGERALVRRFVVDLLHVQTAAMAPTILEGDYVVADATDPRVELGDVVVLRAPEPPRDLVALRVVGVAGDVIEVRDGRLARNGAAIPRCRIGPLRLGDPSVTGAVAEASLREGELWLEWLGARAHLTFDETREGSSRAGARASASMRDGGPWAVGPGEIFVVGDDRDDARDGRHWFGGRGGPIAIERVVGRAPRVLASDSATRFRPERMLLDLRGVPRLPSEALASTPALARCLAGLAPRE